MDVNGRIIFIETIPGMEVGIKENGKGGEFKYDRFDLL
jgi:hypothetical protein